MQSNMGKLKAIAVEFLQLTAAGQAPAAFERYAAPGFRHHNVHFKAGAATLRDAMQENAAQFPDKVLEIQRALEDGSLVAVHSRVSMDKDGPTMALAHVFRFEGGRIVELWDIGQAVPPDSPNSDGAF